MPWPGGIKVQDEAKSIQENNFEEEVLKNKPLDFYKFLIEKVAELKFSLGEFLESKGIFKSRYLYLFLCFFNFIWGWYWFRIFRNKLNKPFPK